MKLENIKIQVIFIGKPQWEAGWPYLGYDNELYMKPILGGLNERFPKIQFNTNKMITTYDENMVKKIKTNILEADGIIIYTIGHYGDPGIVQAGIEFIELGKYVILANCIYAGDHTFTKIYASIKDRDLRVYPISSRNIDDFIKPIEIMVNLLRIKEKKVLCHAADLIQFNWNRILELVNPERKRILKEHPEFIEQIGKMKGDKDFKFYTDTVGADQAHQWRKDEEKYKKNLKDIFEVEMIREEPDEILKYYDNVGDEEAKKIADKWIKNAIKVEPTEKTLLNSAKLYIAFKNFLTEKNIDIYTPDCGTFLLCGKFPAFPCMAFFELSNEGIYGICESDMDSTISFIFGLYLTGRAGFVSNHTFDLINNQITYMHCMAPNKLLGIDGAPADYEIFYHAESSLLGASPCVKFPIGEIATTIKISVLEKKIEIRQGKIIENIVDKKGCVSKVLVETNAKKILETYDWETFGWHRVTFVGDWKEKFIIGAKMLGLEIIDQTL
ncbi:MAG: hypothetical protein ACTSUT_15980 [Promethearchaeota archaeon]